MLISSAAKVAKITVGPISPTTLAPTVKSPTPMTVPAVMVMASRRPRQRLNPGIVFVSRMVRRFPSKEAFFSAYAKKRDLPSEKCG